MSGFPEKRSRCKAIRYFEYRMKFGAMLESGNSKKHEGNPVPADLVFVAYSMHANFTCNTFTSCNLLLDFVSCFPHFDK